MAATADAPVTGDDFRDVIGRFATGVTVVTTRDDDGDHGMTASAVSSLSLDPPMLLVCVNRRSRTGDAVRTSGRFTVNVLAEDQAVAAQHFAVPAEDKFGGVSVTRGPLGTLLLDGCLAHIDCTVDDTFSAATHDIVTGRVQRVAARDGAPLAYFRGQFGRLHPPHQDPIDVAAVNDALDARLAIELGAVELAIDRADPDGVARLRHRAAATVDPPAGDLVDVERYAAANAAFHQALVGLAESAALLDAYRRLRLDRTLARGVAEAEELGGELGRDHLEIADAIAAHDLSRARAAVRGHTERARAAVNGPGRS